MSPSKQNAVFVMVAGLAAFATYNIAYGLKTGEIRGKLDWIALADDPESFWNNVIGNAAAVVVLVTWLWVINLRSRK